MNGDLFYFGTSISVVSGCRSGGWPATTKVDCYFHQSFLFFVFCFLFFSTSNVPHGTTTLTKKLIKQKLFAAPKNGDTISILGHPGSHYWTPESFYGFMELQAAWCCRRYGAAGGLALKVVRCCMRSDIAGVLGVAEGLALKVGIGWGCRQWASAPFSARLIILTLPFNIGCIFQGGGTDPVPSVGIFNTFIEIINLVWKK